MNDLPVCRLKFFIFFFLFNANRIFLKEKDNDLTNFIIKFHTFNHFSSVRSLLFFFFLSLESAQDLGRLLLWDNHWGNSHWALKTLEILKMQFKVLYEYESPGIVKIEDSPNEQL